MHDNSYADDPMTCKVSPKYAPEPKTGDLHHKGRPFLVASELDGSFTFVGDARFHIFARQHQLNGSAIS